MCRQEIARLKGNDPKMNHKRAFSIAADSVKPLAPLMHHTLAALLLAVLPFAVVQSVVLTLYMSVDTQASMSEL